MIILVTQCKNDTSKWILISAFKKCIFGPTSPGLPLPTPTTHPSLLFQHAPVYLILDWPQSFLFLCYIYLAFLHFFSSASLIQFASVAEQKHFFSDKGVKWTISDRMCKICIPYQKKKKKRKQRSKEKVWGQTNLILIMKNFITLF